MITLRDFIHMLKSQNHLVQHSKQYHKKGTVQQLSFELLHFRIPQYRLKTQNHLAQQNSLLQESTAQQLSFEWSYNFGIPFTTLKVEPPCTAYCRTQESTAQQLSFEWTHLRISCTDSEQDHRKVLLSSFHFNGRCLGLYPDSKVRTTLYSVIISITKKHCSVAFI